MSQPSPVPNLLTFLAILTLISLSFASLFFTKFRIIPHLLYALPRFSFISPNAKTCDMRLSNYTKGYWKKSTFQDGTFFSSVSNLAQHYSFNGKWMDISRVNNQPQPFAKYDWFPFTCKLDPFDRDLFCEKMKSKSN